MNNNKRKRLNLEEKLNIIKTKETENLSVRVLAERFCISKSQVNLNI
jgi:transposase